ncbi:hypothetical protein [Methylophilus sp. DW102]|jgi:hypothetical protein|uniref:hypothetical protein n=1 Tax=Methylophilus sp. DW102 TaxID=3095607 RepID=UPI00308AACB4|nr:hypothetical protein MTDW_11400 [Methylophilus sp. DW102]
MYLWKVDSLVKDFKSGKVSQKEEFKYMLMFTILMSVASNQALYIESIYNYYDALSSALVFGISIFGVYYCYKINSCGDDRDFLVRVFCIGLPVLIRVSAVMIPLLIGSKSLETLLLNPEFLNEVTVETTVVDVVVISTSIAAYYWYLATKIRAVSSKNA